MSFGKTAEFVRKREIRFHKIGLIFEKASVQIVCNSIYPYQSIYQILHLFNQK